MNETIRIPKKWKRLLSYTIWVYEYYHSKTNNELDIDIVDKIMLTGIRKVLSRDSTIKLDVDQLLTFMIVLDYVNKKLLNDLESPFTRTEMKQFKESQQFMERYNKSKDIYADWMRIKQEPITINY
jgi:hypothetical protein